MPTEHTTIVVGPVFATNSSNRTVSGVVVPLGEVTSGDARRWIFKRNSVTFDASRSALTIGHGEGFGGHPVGRLVSSKWTDRGLEATFKLSATAAADEALVLAADKVYNLSVGLSYDVAGTHYSDGSFVVNRAVANHVALTNAPAFSGSLIDSVTFTCQGVDMPDAPPTIEVGAPAPTPTPPPAPAPVTPPMTFSVEQWQALTQALAQQPPAPVPVAGPEPQPIPQAVVVSEPPTYRFDGRPGQHSWVQDAYAGYGKGDGEARQRIEQFLEKHGETFAVVQADVSALTPKGFRPDLYVDQRDVRRPLGALVSGGTLDSILTFTVPKFGSASNLVNPHVEMVEPTLATLTATDQEITSHALSGKAEISRELADKAGPQVDAMIWSKMLRAASNAAELRLANVLAGVTDASPLALNGADAELAVDVDTTFMSVTGSGSVDRFDVLACSPALFSKLATARDSTGRRLYPASAPSNPDGARTGLWSLDLGNGMQAAQVPSLVQSYLIERAALYQWLSAPKKLNFDIQVKSIFLGFWQYSAEAIIDDDGIKRVTYTA